MSRKLSPAVRPRALRYGVAIGSVAISLVLFEFLWVPSLGREFPFLLFYTAVICTAWYGGFGPGLLATVLADLGVAFFLFEPRYSFAIRAPSEQIATALFFVFGGGISWLGESLLRDNRRLEDYGLEIAFQRDLLKNRTDADIRLLSSLIDQAHDAILIRQPGGSISYWNRGAERLYGWTREQALGRVSQELLDTRFPKPLTEIEADVARKGSWEGEIVHTRSDGELVVVASRWVADRNGPSEATPILEINSDITERKRVEKALRTSEERFRAVAEHTYDWEYWMTPEGKIAYCSPSCERLTGYSPGEYLRDPDLLARIIHPDHALAWAQHRAVCVESQESFDEDFLIITRGGETRWIAHACTAVYNDDGRLLGRRASNRDITARKQAEEQLRTLSRAIEQSPSSIVITDARGIIEYVNPKFTEVTGYSPEEVRGKNPRLLKSGETKPEEYRLLWETITAGREWRGEFHNRKKNGELFWELASISPVLDEHGVVTHFIAIKEDITASKRAEAELRLRTRLIDLAHDAILIRQPGNVISYWNEGAERIYGWSRDEAVGQISHELLKTQSPERLAEIEAEVLREGSWEGELVRFRSDGRLVVVSSRWVADRNGTSGAIPILEISSDITDRKQAEEALASAHEELASQAEGLTRSNRELEQFAYVASHDLQEPLRMVASYLELLADRYKGRLDEKADKFINYAVDGAARMKILIDDLLGYSRVTTKERSIELLDIGAALDQATKNLGKAIAERGAVVTQGTLPSALVNRTHLVQLFQNLIGNALKFCENTPRIHVWAERNEQGWVVAVRDNGIGIAPEHHERIFQIFQRLHGRDKYAGTGIGLAICKKIVEQYGGRIWVESQPGKGSTFFFTLPAVD